MLTIIGVGTFIINFPGPASSQRHDPSCPLGHALSCTPFPEEPTNVYVPGGLDVLTIRGRHVTEIVAFLSADLEVFGLPARLTG